MGKKTAKTPSDLGRSLMKDKVSKRKKPGSSLLHTAELQDGQDYSRINFKSITEQTDIDSFLLTAELAGTDFQAERMNTHFVKPSSSLGLLSHEDKAKIKSAQQKHKSSLQIPRRPPWDRSMDSNELNEAERESFLTWRRDLSQLQEEESILLTPYEKNLEFWRQLWRVVERSDVVVQIVDARNPLLFWCEDLHNYTKEVNPLKENLVLINKSDFLTCQQRRLWASYFANLGQKAVFFSALIDKPLPVIEECDTNETYPLQQIEDRTACLAISDSSNDPSTTGAFVNSPRMLTHSELIEVFRLFKSTNPTNSYTTVGLVGYPNVGKSSTINCLLQEKKVSVSATPGKTKHFQTLFLTDDILLCDCPGLVFPAFVSTREEMIINGILPIDQMRDHVPPMNLILSQIPRFVLEDKYGIFIPAPQEGEDPDRPPTSEEFLNSYGLMRGFMTSRGLPDNPRTARYTLKDYLNGKLLYCLCPPGENQGQYQTYEEPKGRKQRPTLTPQQQSTLPFKKGSEDVDATFFNHNTSKAHAKNKSIHDAAQPTEHPKPWRVNNTKRNRKVKSRIKYAHLDK